MSAMLLATGVKPSVLNGLPAAMDVGPVDAQPVKAAPPSNTVPAALMPPRSILRRLKRTFSTDSKSVLAEVFESSLLKISEGRLLTLFMNLVTSIKF